MFGGSAVKNSHITCDETIAMADDGKDKITQTIGKGNIDDVIRGKLTANRQNQRRRFSSSDSMNNETLIIAQSEDDIVSFGAEDTVLIIKEGLIEGQVTVKEIAQALHDRKDDDVDETDEHFQNLYGGGRRRRSSVVRDRQLEAAAAELGDRMI